MGNLEHPDESDEDMGQLRTDAIVFSHYDCMVVRVCQEAYVEAQCTVHISWT